MSLRREPAGGWWWSSSTAARRLGGVGNQASQVRSGTVDIALGLRGAEGDKFPRTSIIELPFLVRDATSGSRALWTLFKQGAFGPEFGEYKVLALFVHNPGLVHTASKPVTVVGDMQGPAPARAQPGGGGRAAAGRALCPSLLQVNDVMPAVHSGQLDGIVTNWGNPLPGFNDAMHFHTDVAVLHLGVLRGNEPGAFRQPAARCTAGDRRAIRRCAGRSLRQPVDKWDAPVRDGATGPGQTVITPDAAAMEGWRAGLRPVTDRYLGELVAGGFTDARGVYDRLGGCWATEAVSDGASIGVSSAS